MTVVQVRGETTVPNTVNLGGTTQPGQFQTEWKITKASTGPDGVMRWKATTTKFSRDVQGDFVKKSFYEEAIRRFKAGQVPAPFFSVAHYPLESICLKCGYVYKSMLDTRCSSCSKERLIAGITTDMWIDGDQPKARGIFFSTALGKAVYASCRQDIEKSVPFDERVRISMGFYPDHDGVTIPKSGCRDFEKGWVEHFAGTRVPVIPETPIEATFEEKSLSIKTKYDDALAVLLSDKSLADNLEELRQNRFLKSEIDLGLVTKADEVRPLKDDQPKAVDKPKELVKNESGVLDETVEVKNETETVAVDDKKDEVKPLEGLKLAEEQPKEAETVKPVEQEDSAEEKIDEPVEEEKEEVIEEEKKSEVGIDLSQDDLLLEAAEAVGAIQKAILAPGTNKQEVIARAANLVNAIRDYVRAIQQMPDNVYGQIPAGIQDVNQLIPVNQPIPPPGEVFDRTSAGRPGELSIDDVLGDLQEPVEGEAEQPEFSLMGDEEDLGEPEEDTGEEEDNLGIDTGEEPTDEELAAEEETSEEGTTEEEVPAEEETSEEEGTEEEAESETPEEESGEGEEAEVEEETEEETPTEETPEEELLPEERKPKQKSPPPGGKKLSFRREGKSVVKSVKTRTEPTAAVKSAVAHPAEALLDRWSKGVVEVLTDGQLSRVQRRALVQKALETFAQQVTEVIDQTTPVSDGDIATIVQKAVEQALAAEQQTRQAESEILRQKINELTQAIVTKEVMGVVGRKGPVRKSLDGRATLVGSTTPVFETKNLLTSESTETTGLKKFSAAEVAKSSVAGGNPLYRY